MRKVMNAVTVCMLSLIMLVMLTSTASAVCWCNNTVLTGIAILPDDADPATGTSKYRITATCADTTSIDPKWADQGARHFYLSDGMGEGGYATILTALSLNKNFAINASDCVSGSLLSLMKMVP